MSTETWSTKADSHIMEYNSLCFEQHMLDYYYYCAEYAWENHVGYRPKFDKV